MQLVIGLVIGLVVGVAVGVFLGTSVLGKKKTGDAGDDLAGSSAGHVEHGSGQEQYPSARQDDAHGTSQGSSGLGGQWGSQQQAASGQESWGQDDRTEGERSWGQDERAGEQQSWAQGGQDDHHQQSWGQQQAASQSWGAQDPVASAEQQPSSGQSGWGSPDVAAPRESAGAPPARQGDGEQDVTRAMPSMAAQPDEDDEHGPHGEVPDWGGAPPSRESAAPAPSAEPTADRHRMHDDMPPGELGWSHSGASYSGARPAGDGQHPEPRDQAPATSGGSGGPSPTGWQAPPTDHTQQEDAAISGQPSPPGWSGAAGQEEAGQHQAADRRAEQPGAVQPERLDQEEPPAAAPGPVDHDAPTTAMRLPRRPQQGETGDAR